MLTKDEEDKVKTMLEVFKEHTEPQEHTLVAVPVHIKDLSWLAGKTLELNDELKPYHTKVTAEFLEPNPLTVEGKVIAFFENDNYKCIFGEHLQATAEMAVEHYWEWHSAC